jgi:Kef-type K+ transport system membrane component KefB
VGHHDLVLFFLQISVILAVALVFGQVARRLHLSAVLGELIGGILLGPTVFAAIAPQLYVRLFPSAGATTVGRDAVIKLGLLLFLFVAGLEVNLAQVRQRGWGVVWTSLSGIVVPFGLGFGLVLLLPGLWTPQANSNVLVFALFMGTALSISALPVIVRVLMELDLTRRDLGMVVMAAATIDDLIGWLLFAVLLSTFRMGDQRPEGGLWITLGLILGFFAITLSVGRWIGPRARRWSQAHLRWPSGFIAMTAILVLVAGAIAETVGIHAVFGAFLVGVALAQSFFVPIYFVSIGLQANFAANFDLLLVSLILVVACAGKIGGASFGAWIGRFPPREALAIGFGMNARGAMGMILASVALEYQLIDQRIFVALIIMALITSVLSGPIMQRLLIVNSSDEINLPI